MIYIQRVIKVFVFAACLAGLLAASSVVFYPKNNTEQAGIEEEQANGILGEKSGTVDVLILGDSESISFMQPEQFGEETGYTAYICGTSGQKLGYTDVMLKRAFQHQQPEVVLLETHVLYNKQTWDDVMFEKICEKITAFRYHNRWKSLTPEDFRDAPVQTWTDPMKGYHESVTVQPADTTGYMLPSDEVDSIASLNRRCVRKIREYCDQKGAKLILISSPSPVNWNMEKHNAVQELAGILGCEYLDLNLLADEICIDWNLDTRDGGDHLNDYGAAKVTTYMSSYLSRFLQPQPA